MIIYIFKPLAASLPVFGPRPRLGGIHALLEIAVRQPHYPQGGHLDIFVLFN
jgi:hypothetical protein